MIQSKCYWHASCTHIPIRSNQRQKKRRSHVPQMNVNRFVLIDWSLLWNTSHSEQTNLVICSHDKIHPAQQQWGYEIVLFDVFFCDFCLIFSLPKLAKIVCADHIYMQQQQKPPDFDITKKKTEHTLEHLNWTAPYTDTRSWIGLYLRVHVWKIDATKKSKAIKFNKSREQTMETQ